MPKNYLDMLDEVRAIAQTGLNYVKSPYDFAQYSRLLELAAEKYADITGLTSQSIIDRFSKELGYITPKVGVQCVLFDPDGKMLLEHRRDDGLWGLPGGWVDTGETPEMAIVREMQEEAALVVEVEKLAGFYTRLPGEYAQPHTSVHIVYLCKYISGVITISHESLAIGYYDLAAITDWHKDHGIIAHDALHLFGGLNATPLQGRGA
jgi:mutator protein MutT